MEFFFPRDELPIEIKRDKPFPSMQLFRRRETIADTTIVLTNIDLIAHA